MPVRYGIILDKNPENSMQDQSGAEDWYADLYFSYG